MRGFALLKDPYRERRLFFGRAVLCGLFSVVLIVLLAARMFYLQVVRHDHFTTLSTNNRVSLQPIAPTRGLIYDRKGVLLAQNLPTFSLEIVQERVQDMDKTLKEIGKLINVTDEDIERFRHDLKRSRRFEAVPLRFRLSDEEVALIAVNNYRLPGVEINSTLTRHYPLGNLTAHSVGYVGRINERELKNIDYSNYAATTYIGKTGVEKSYETLLHGNVGMQQVETNARGRVLRVLEHKLPTPGQNLYLNLDIELQRAAEKAFGKERGALVAIEPGTGAVLSLVSVPGYDPNLFVNGIPLAAYQQLSTSKDQPLFNRALRGQYPPGSTVKPFIGLAGLELNTVTTLDNVDCNGYYLLKGDERRYRDWKKRGHGTIGLTRAIVESCDVYFYDLALNLGIDNISSYLSNFGFGMSSNIDTGDDASGLLPSREWKRKARREPWFPGETLITGIGQGFFLATPLQMANATATFASRGKLMKPTIVSKVEDPASHTLNTMPPTELNQVPISEAGNWWRIERAMTKVVHDAHGTARRINHGLQYKVAGKTGTSQVFGIKQDEEYVAEDIQKHLRDHALFIAFAPVEEPKIAVAVIVENGGSGGAAAAPIARQVMDSYLVQQNPSGEGKHATQ